jgi:hypothetical protein
MSESVLIIENNSIDFNQLKKNLPNFNLLPKDYSDYNGLFSNSFDYTKIKQFAYTMIQNNYKTIKAIIVDISLKGSDDDEFGLDLIEYIRTCSEFSFNGSSGWCSAIPIFCFTKHGQDADMKRKAYDRKVTNFFLKRAIKDDPGELTFLKQSIILHKRSFCSYLNYPKDDLKFNIQMLHETSENLIKLQNELTKEGSTKLYESICSISAKLDDMTLIIDNNHTQIISHLSILFQIHLETCSDDKKKAILNTYRTELMRIISEDQFKKLESTKWKQFVSAFKSINSGGGFTEFVNCGVDMLQEAGITDNVSGRIIGIALKGITGILASA